MEKQTKPRVDPVLAVIASLAAILNIFGIWQESTGNAYYTAAITSMLQNWHNFFFVSFDPGGFVSIDKPPVVFWIQTAFAAIFGVHGWSVILPQALAGVGSVILLYVMIKPSFGQAAARTAALVMALSPIAVAVSRTNNIDSLLVFTLCAASWMLLKGVRQARPAWVLGAAAVIGIGFNMKMLQAYLIVPAVGLYFLLAWKSEQAASGGIISRLRNKWALLAACAVVMAAVSMSWALVVDAIPSSERPYVGGSQSNSVVELALGYNGMQRLLGQDGMGGPGSDQNNGSDGPGAIMSPDDQEGSNANAVINSDPYDDSGQSASSNSGVASQSQESQENQMATGNMTGPGAPPSGNGGPGQGGGMFGTGNPGVLRLFQSELSGQISWLLPFALLASAVLLIGYGRRREAAGERNEVIYWLGWLLTGMAFFSTARFFHQYYLIMLAPPIAALCGAGLAGLAELYRQGGWKRWLLPALIAADTIFEMYILWPYRSQIGDMVLIIISVTALGVLAAMAAVASRPRAAGWAVAAGLALMLAIPAWWSAIPMIDGNNAMLPEAGLGKAAGMGGPGGNQPGNPPGMNNSFMQPGFPGGPVQDTDTQTGNANGQADDSNVLPGTPESPAGLNDQQADSNAAENPGFPGNGNRGGGPGGFGMDQQLLDYLIENNTGEKYLFACPDANSASSYIIATGLPVMAMGGFGGSDPILTEDSLAQMVRDGEVKFFIMSGGGRGNSQLQNWIKENGVQVPSSEWMGDGEDGTAADASGDRGQVLYRVDL